MKKVVQSVPSFIGFVDSRFHLCLGWMGGRDGGKDRGEGVGKSRGSRELGGWG